VLKVVPATTEPDVLAKAAAKDAPTSTATEERTETATGEEDGTEEELPANVAPKIAKKVNQLLKQRKELRDQVAQLQPASAIGSELSDFARQNDLSSDDIIKAISLAAAIRHGDWHGFYAQVGPYVRRAQEYLGLVLPEDLGQRVRQGHMTEAAAREFARTRFDANRAQALADAQSQQNQVMQVHGIQQEVQRAVANYETRLAAADPDYRAKADAIRRTTQAMLHERGGQIHSVQEAVDIVYAAYNEVTNQYRRLMPAPRATNPVPNGNSQQPSAHAAPKNLMEAALLGLERSRRHV